MANEKLTAKELHYVFRSCGDAYFGELTEQQREGWERVARAVALEVDDAHKEGYNTGHDEGYHEGWDEGYEQHQADTEDD